MRHAGGSHMYTFEIEVYDLDIKDNWMQGRYLVRGYEDVFWTDDLDAALLFIKISCEAILEGDD